MEPAYITQTITHYLAENFKNLRGTMPNERHFLVRGKTNSYSREDSKIAIGTAIDVLAEVIEKEQFFGFFVLKYANQASNRKNAELVPLNDGDKVYSKFQVKLLKSGLFVAAERVKPKKYLDILRTPEGFKQSAGLLGIGGNLEKIASIIYVSH